MMGKKDGQIQMIVMDIANLIPENHLLLKIDKCIDFDFIYEKAAPYYSDRGRKSIDSVCMIKMLLVGYLYGIKSERRLEEDVTLNLAYRWFCGFNLNDRIPDHSLFSQNRRRRFKDSQLFREIFNHIVILCIQNGIVTGENVVSDGSFIPGNVSANSMKEVVRQVEKSTVKYLDALEVELKQQPGYREPEPIYEEKLQLKSSTDKGCRYIHQKRKRGLDI
jgi:Transposase and inactivated derivatives